MTDYGKLKSALGRLEEQLDNYQTNLNRPGLSALDKDAIAESVIKRFETAFDMLWKTLKRHLVEKYGVTDIPNSPRPILRIANENNLLSGKIESWMDYVDARIATAHDYSLAKAKETLATAPAFLADAIQLFREMTGESW